MIRLRTRCRWLVLTPRSSWRSPDQEAVFAAGSGHKVMPDKPEVAVDAIERIVTQLRAARQPSRVSRRACFWAPSSSAEDPVADVYAAVLSVRNWTLIQILKHSNFPCVHTGGIQK